MENFRGDSNRIRICGNYHNIEEPEYDVVDDHEEALRVRILPARPMNDEREYADRDLPRSSSSQSLSSISPGNNPPERPPRDTRHTTGPAINRNLKPGRRKTKSDKALPPLPPDDQLLITQPSQRSSSSPSSFNLDLVNHFAGLAQHECCRKQRQLGETEEANFALQHKGPHGAESAPAHQINQRHSLDLETHDLDKRLHQNLERVPSRRRHHEWPQTKEDIDQRDFCPVKRPQTYCEEDWYVGACKRTDAEHALHLMNKDGAFLVRDCSVNTNSEPLVLVVYHEKKVYNVKIRFIASTRKYALGTGQRSNDTFDSVADIIKFHSIFPIILISGRNMSGIKYPENCVLSCPITNKDLEQLLQ
ncbi:uncharacterized protein [Leuresthes tenuis]|uniref:uncharacterized protein n=1 Tax=Leuresthes tenuis TaxID=355514 RepID=UPI003B50EE9A